MAEINAINRCMTSWATLGKQRQMVLSGIEKGIGWKVKVSRIKCRVVPNAYSSVIGSVQLSLLTFMD